MLGNTQCNTKKCVVILPSGHHVTTLIIRHYHETSGHVGVQQALYKILDIERTQHCKRALKGCIVCKRQHAPLCTQQLAPLLDVQMTPDKLPFTFVGIDFFGPLNVKAGRTHLKRYG